MTFGEVIRNRRRELGLLGRAVAERANIHPPAYSRLEKDVHQPTPKTVKAVCQALSLDPDTLRPLEGPRPTIAHWVPVDEWVKEDRVVVLACTCAQWEACYPESVFWEAIAGRWVATNRNSDPMKPTHIAPLPGAPHEQL